MRAMADFPSDEKCFYLPPGGLRPPEALLHCVFPKLDYWFHRFKNGDGVDHNYALDGFFRLLFFSVKLSFKMQCYSRMNIHIHCSKTHCFTFRIIQAMSK